MDVNSPLAFVFAAMVVAGFFSAYKFQWQSLFFMMAVFYATYTNSMGWGVFFGLSIFHIAICLFAGFLNGTLKSK